jgi:hypothetical protein
LAGYRIFGQISGEARYRIFGRISGEARYRISGRIYVSKFECLQKKRKNSNKEIKLRFSQTLNISFSFHARS